MTLVEIGRDDVEQVCRRVEDDLGLTFDESRIDELAKVICRRMRELDCDNFSSYRSRLRGEASAEELCILAQYLTVGETFFFRQPAQFQVFQDIVLSTRMQAHSTPLRILSCGCASGEEAFTLAMVVDEALQESSLLRDVRISAIDVNRTFLQLARRGRYGAWSLRETPPHILSRYFRREGRNYVLNEKIRAAVTFEERNLMSDDPNFWAEDAFDAVFCRNVIMYFHPEAARACIARIARALVPDGFLFLGHAETLRGISHEFSLQHTHDTFYYKRVPGISRKGPATQSRPNPSLAFQALPLDESWVQAIRRSSERIAELAASRGQQAVASTAGSVGRPGGSLDLRHAFALLAQERYAEALESLPPTSPLDIDAQLLRAAILTNRGEIPTAERICNEILALDELNAGTHYLMALCKEYAGDLAAAREHDRIAIYLDASFAMPHLHLGLMCKRASEAEEARDELQQALALLAREEVSRLLLFGGGFGREALMQFCRAEIGDEEHGR